MCNSCCCCSITIGPIAIIANTTFSNIIMIIITTIIVTIVHNMPNTLFGLWPQYYLAVSHQSFNRNKANIILNIILILMSHSMNIHVQVIYWMTSENNKCGSDTTTSSSKSTRRTWHCQMECQGSTLIKEHQENSEAKLCSLRYTKISLCIWTY